MKQWHDKIYSPLLAVLWNLLLVFLVYQIARLEYCLENATYLTYTFDVFKGGLLFDASAILYTNVLYIVMLLFPLHWKENKTYQQLCKWLFMIVNGIAFAINLADSVYFQFTMRRTTTSVVQEFSHEGNLAGIIGKGVSDPLVSGVTVLLGDDGSLAFLCQAPPSESQDHFLVAIRPCLFAVVAVAGSLHHCRNARRFHHGRAPHHVIECQSVCGASAGCSAGAQYAFCADPFYRKECLHGS